MARHRILLVDDHPVVRLGLRQMISQEADLEVCGEAETATAARGAVEETRPDLVLVDLSLPDRSGLELVKELAALGSPPRMLVLSMLDEKLYARRALEAGASGYVHKEEAAGELLGAIRRVLAGEVYLSPEMTQLLLRRAVAEEGAESATGVEALTDRELEVFSLLGEGSTTREIARRLRRSVKTIESHREKIKVKLGIEHNNELIRRAVEWSLREG
ncbi:MAG: response regulator transcription factor [Thermoanaerobaculia bacterium]|nr:response regulator transcription factor [Thermoanaerobaculia bacterium]